MPPGTRPRLAPGARLQWDPVRQRHVLLRPEGLLVLNATGSAILVLCDGERSVASIAAELGPRRGRAVTEAIEEIVVFLDRLASKRLVVFDAKR
jgi:pyrroloquinoline quinone biosynthesis protein D